MPLFYTEATANLLTDPTLDPFGNIPRFKFHALRVNVAGPTRVWSVRAR